jgi:hypothetical protein
MSVIRKDNQEYDMDPIGIMFLDLSSPTLSAGYIRHGNWHPNRTMTQEEAKKCLEEINNKTKNKLNIAPSQFEAAHKRINSFLFSKQQQDKSRKSRKW